jgi:hypothetical protein
MQNGYLFGIVRPLLKPSTLTLSERAAAGVGASASVRPAASVAKAAILIFFHRFSPLGLVRCYSKSERVQ